MEKRGGGCRRRRAGHVAGLSTRGSRGGNCSHCVLMIPLFLLLRLHSLLRGFRVCYLLAYFAALVRVRGVANDVDAVRFDCCRVKPVETDFVVSRGAMVVVMNECEDLKNYDSWKKQLNFLGNWKRKTKKDHLNLTGHSNRLKDAY